MNKVSRIAQSSISSLLRAHKKKGTIIFAIPSYNEADNIGQLTQIIDEGLQKYYKHHDALILNVDNDSPDDTRGAFLRTRTKTRKKYISSKGHPKKYRGKGYHMKLALEYAVKKDAIAIGFIDGDVESVKPEWIKKLISPILAGYDQIIPLYLRNEYDGSITNMLVFPTMYGFLNTNIRQPIGGETALSRTAMRLFLGTNWNNTAYWYGVDIFFVLQGIFHKLKNAQVALGIKKHKPSAPKLDAMFLQVSNSLLGQLRIYKKEWDKRHSKPKNTPTLVKRNEHLHTPEVAFNYKYRKEHLVKEFKKHKHNLGAVCNKALINHLRTNLKENKTFTLSARDWAEILYTALHRKKRLSKKDLVGLRVLFFVRFLTFYREVLDMSHKESEKHIIKQAKTFRTVRRTQKARTSIQ